jgi:hypothetical protein
MGLEHTETPSLVRLFRREAAVFTVGVFERLFDVAAAALLENILIGSVGRWRGPTACKSQNDEAKKDAFDQGLGGYGWPLDWACPTAPEPPPGEPNSRRSMVSVRRECWAMSSAT